MKSGSVDSFHVSTRCGFSPNARHIRDTVDCDNPDAPSTAEPGQHREAVTIFESGQVGLRDSAAATVRAIVTGLEARTRAAAGDAAGFRSTIARGTAILDSARAGDLRCLPGQLHPPGTFGIRG